MRGSTSAWVRGKGVPYEAASPGRRRRSRAAGPSATRGAGSGRHAWNGHGRRTDLVGDALAHEGDLDGRARACPAVAQPGDRPKKSTQVTVRVAASYTVAKPPPASPVKMSRPRS